jgi:hypothetical protein
MVQREALPADYHSLGSPLCISASFNSSVIRLHASVIYWVVEYGSGKGFRGLERDAGGWGGWYRAYRWACRQGKTTGRREDKQVGGQAFQATEQTRWKNSLWVVSLIRGLSSLKISSVSLVKRVVTFQRTTTNVVMIWSLEFIPKLKYIFHTEFRKRKLY